MNKLIIKLNNEKKMRNYSYFICSYDLIHIYHKKYLNAGFYKEWTDIKSNSDYMIDYYYRTNNLANPIQQ